MAFPALARSRGYYKPSGVPRLNRQSSPSALFCLPCATPAFEEIALGTRVSANTTTALALSPFGVGAAGRSTASCLSYQLFGQQPAIRFSLEALVVPSATTAGTIAGWNSDNVGTGNSYDRTLGINATLGQFVFYIFDGSSKSIAGGLAVAGRLFHLVGTSDGSNIRLYVNGGQVGSLPAGNAYTGYANPFFCVGKCQAGQISANCYSGVTLLAIFHTKVLSPAEIAGRAADPFRYLVYPEDFVSGMMFGRAAPAPPAPPPAPDQVTYFPIIY